MDDYIVKPVNKKELERIINTYFYYYWIFYINN